MEWKRKDHSRDTEPSVLVASPVLGIDVMVHKHIHHGDDWLMTCDVLGIKQRALGTDNLMEAQTRAMQIFVLEAQALRERLTLAIGEMFGQ